MLNKCCAKYLKRESAQSQVPTSYLLAGIRMEEIESMMQMS